MGNLGQRYRELKLGHSFRIPIRLRSLRISLLFILEDDFLGYPPPALPNEPHDESLMTMRLR